MAPHQLPERLGVVRVDEVAQRMDHHVVPHHADLPGVAGGHFLEARPGTDRHTPTGCGDPAW